MVYYAKQEVNMKPSASSSEIFYCSFFLLLCFLHVYALLVPGATNKKKKIRKGMARAYEKKKRSPCSSPRF
jgi:hypothetical protein